MNDIEIIYNELKDKYPLVLANSLTLNEGFSWNVPVICGKRKNAKFFLYADKNTLSPSGEEFVFSVVYRFTAHRIISSPILKNRIVLSQINLYKTIPFFNTLLNIV
jgi:hypothetical protein